MKRFIGIFVGCLLGGSCVYGASGAYIGIGGALQAVPKEQNDGLGLVVKGGMGLDSLLPRLGVEGEVCTSIVDPDVRGHESDILTLGGYLTYTIPIPGSITYVRPRFGVILPNLGDEESVNSRNIALSTGVLLGWQISGALSGYVDYTNLGERINNYGAGLKIAF